MLKNFGCAPIIRHMDIAAFVVISGAAAALGIWLGIRIARRAGMRTDMPPAKRTRFVVMMVATLGIGLFAAWAITNGHAVVGIGVLVAFYVLPNLVLIPVRIRQANQRAEEARARRERSSPHSSPP